MTTLERFWAKVQKSESCWIWVAALDGHGYGHFWHQGKVRKAYRVAYELFVGPVPGGMQLDHLCRVRACVNPDHLEPVTQRTNILRGESVTARLSRETQCVAGHEFTPANTYVPADGGRRCRACKRARDNAAYARRIAS